MDVPGGGGGGGGDTDVQEVAAKLDETKLGKQENGAEEGEHEGKHSS